MAGHNDMPSWYLRQHKISTPAAAVAPAKSVRRESSNVGVDAVVQELLVSNAKTAGNIAGTIEDRLLDRPYLLDNPATHGGATERAKDRAHRARSKRSAKHFSMRQHRHAGSYDLPAEYHKYALFLPMHEMWETYTRSLVKDCSESMLRPRLLTADLHGAILAVVESKSSSYVGIQGIMVRETDQTFGIITVQDKFRVVPKTGAVFMFQLDSLRITLFGNNLFSRQLHPRKQRQLKPTIELTFKKMAPKAVKEIRKFAQQTMGTSAVRLDVKLNKHIWSRGVRNVPTRIRGRIARKRKDDEDAREELYSYVSVTEVPAEGYRNLESKVVEDEG